MARRPRNTHPTDAELEILGVLWERGPSTVRDVLSRLNARRQTETGYTTVLKTMQIMTEKGWLERDESRRSHVYRPRESADRTRGNLLEHVMDRAFEGSTARLVLQALSARPADPSELREIRAMLDRIEKRDRR